MDTRYCPYCMTYYTVDKEVCPACGHRPSEFETTFGHVLPTGTVLRYRYLLGRTLCTRRFYTIYLGRDMTWGRKVAIHEYNPYRMRLLLVDRRVREEYDRGRDEFLAEARRLAGLEKRPALTAVTDVFQANDTAYMVTEFIEGAALKEHVARQGPMGFEDVAEKLLPVAEDLAAVHDAGLLHRDIAPDHIMLTPEGRCVLAGFNCFVQVDDHDDSWDPFWDLSRSGFVPRDGADGQSKRDARTDVYALCAVIYYCITGQVPPEGHRWFDAADSRRPDPLKPPSALGAKITPAEERVLLWGMAPRQEDRPRDMRQLAKSIREARAKGL